ncbi:hypothetical protein [Actinoplanes sp. NPDC049265]|uniref:hypothetical protein n=1 Tax=Actinoplanes sp. NPDC049265 TaxID=3363902 RepID=UPI00371E90DE
MRPAVVTAPGVEPGRAAAAGARFVAIPGFTDLGTKVSQEISAALTGPTTVDQALDDGQKLAEAVAAKHK